MEKLTEFAGEHYVLFLTITLLFLFALIGYIVDARREKNDLFRKKENAEDEESFENIVVPEGKKLNEMVSNTKAINPDSKQVILTDESILNNGVNDPLANPTNSVQNTGQANIPDPSAIIQNPTVQNQNQVQ